MCNPRSVAKVEASLPGPMAADPLPPTTVTAEPRPRLEITFEPESGTYRDEGGRFNYLCAYLVLRVGKDGVPAAVLAAAGADGRVPLDCALEFEDGSSVPVTSKSGKPGLRVLGLAGADRVSSLVAASDAVLSSAVSAEAADAQATGEAASCDVHSLRGSVRYKIMKLSRNHDGKRFCLRVRLAGISDDVIVSARTRPTLVLSKRKWLKADARAPEIAQRKRVEAQAAQQNVELARAADTKRAKTELHTSLRALCGLVPLESKYPRHASAGESIHGCSDAEDAGDAESYEPRGTKRKLPQAEDDAAAIVGTRLSARIQQRQRRSSSAGDDASSIFTDDTGFDAFEMFPSAAAAPTMPATCELAAMRERLARQDKAAEASAARLALLEKENALLKRRLGNSPPCALPRTHSLGIMGLDDAMHEDIDDWAGVFEAEQHAKHL